MHSVFNIDIVSTAKVLVVGCGALGNEVLKDLVMSGVKHIVIVDFDMVEEKNLCHSVLFRHADIGMPKAEAAAARLLEICPDIDVTPIIGSIEHNVGLGLVRSMDVAISCVDSRWARYCINRLCMRANLPWIDGGIAYLDGTVRVFAPGQNCYACNLGPEALADIGRHLSCADVAQRSLEQLHAPTTIISASIIAAIEVQEALKVITNRYLPPDKKASTLLGKMLSYDGDTPDVKIVDFKAYDDDCPVHGQWRPVIMIGIDANATVEIALAEMLEYGSIAIHTVDFAFVDFIEHRINGSTLKLMCPSYMVEGKIKAAGPKADASAFLTHSYDIIDQTFPYKHLSLSDIGFADQAIIMTSDAQGRATYFQLKAAAKNNQP